MKIKNIILVTAAGFFLSGLFAFKMLSNSWQVNSKDAKITFTMPNGDKTGTVGGLNATLDFNPMDVKLFTMKATVEVKTINTGIEKLNAHLMTTDFFDEAKHPTISFTAESITRNDGGYIATGKLAIRDSVHTVNIPFTFQQKEKNAIISGTLDIHSSDYGVGKKEANQKDRVVIAIEIPLTQE